MKDFERIDQLQKEVKELRRRLNLLIQIFREFNDNQHDVDKGMLTLISQLNERRK